MKRILIAALLSIALFPFIQEKAVNNSETKAVAAVVSTETGTTNGTSGQMRQQRAQIQARNLLTDKDGEQVAKLQATTPAQGDSAKQEKPESRSRVADRTTDKPSEPAPQQTPITENERLMQQANIPKEDWNATSYIVSKESSWCYKRVNGDHRSCDAITQPTLKDIGSKAYGLCQAYPVTKMASEGADYLTNPLTQLRWCHKYAQERYKGWNFAYAFWRSNRWW